MSMRIPILDSASAAPRGTSHWWVVPLGAAALEIGAMIFIGHLSRQGSLDADTAENLTRAAWALLLGTVAMAAVEHLATSAAKHNKTWALHHFSSPIRRGMTLLLATPLIGAAALMVLIGLFHLLLILVPLVMGLLLIGLLFSPLLLLAALADGGSSGSSSSNTRYVDPHPGYYKNANYDWVSRAK